jgi:MoaA/NifB/PqqE/SkfB family radical SAM enzyme
MPAIITFIKPTPCKMSLKDKLRQYFSVYHQPHPKTVQIEVTNLCNLNCRTCGRKRFLAKFGSMSLTDYQNILNKFQIKQIQKIHFGGYGEPLMNKRLVDMVKMIAHETYTSTNTNLSIHNNDLIVALANSGLAEINVSLDAFDQEVYQDVRQGGNWHLVINNLKLIIHYKRPPTRLQLHCVVYRRNLNSYLHNISNLLEMLPVDKMVFVGMKSHGSNEATASQQKFFSQDQIDFLRSITQKNNVELAIKNNKALDMCFRPNEEMYILFDGSVTPCCNIVDDRFFSFGNLLESNQLDDIWNSASAINFRKNLASGSPHRLCTTICGLKRT